MSKILNKSDWIKILKRNTNKNPDHDEQYKKQYFVPENLVVNIVTQKRIYEKKFIFSGKFDHAVLDFSEDERLIVRIWAKEPYIIYWKDVRKIMLNFISFNE